MKNIWNVLCTLLLVHLIGMGVLLGWMVSSDRLNRDRVNQVVSLFKPTIKEAELAAKEAEKAEQERRDKQVALARLEQVSRGPTTTAARLSSEQEAEEVSMQKIAFLQQNVSNLTMRLENDKAQLHKLKDELDKSRQAFEKAVQGRRQDLQDEDFRQAVRMYEQLKPKQAKVMFQEMLTQGRRQQVVDYLASMQLRKAAAVLGEFKEGEEILQATELLQGLRDRGINSLTRQVDEPKGDAT